MNFEQIKELISIVEKSGITSFEIEESGYRIRIGKEDSANQNRQQSFYEPIKAVSSKTDSNQETLACDTSSMSELVLAPQNTDSKFVEVKSPMLGVFYSSPAPDAPAFVEVGDRVKKGTVLCIIEAMKLMNEILAEKDGEIAEICLENGQIVEFSQVMFKMK